MRRLQPNFETEATAMRVVMEHEQAQGRQVYDVHEKNLGYDITSLDLELRRAAADRGQGARRRRPARSCSRPTSAASPRTGATATGSTSSPTATPRRGSRSRSSDPARLDWHEVTKVAHYYLTVDAMTQPDAGARGLAAVRRALVSHPIRSLKRGRFRRAQSFTGARFR